MDSRIYPRKERGEKEEERKAKGEPAKGDGRGRKSAEQREDSIGPNQAEGKEGTKDGDMGAGRITFNQLNAEVETGTT
jgi:hypothetical protein